MDAPEVRLSPAKHAIAYKFPEDRRWTIQYGTGFERFVTDDTVAEWTPLLPVSKEDGAS